MASRSPPPQGHPSAGIRPPARQSVALRWLNNVAPSSAAPKAAQPPAKRWPPVGAPATATPKPAVEKATVSAFQSARAMFEAKKAPATAAAPPPPPPVRRRLNFPVPAPAVVQQHPAASALSGSSCSTVDSECDHKLEESVAVKHESKHSPVHVVVKTVEKESVVATAPERNSPKSAPPPMEAMLRPPIPVTQAPRSSGVAAIAATPEQLSKRDQTDTDPFRLLLPVEAVPTLPDEVPCVYDNAAVEMQKSIKKVVRKLLKKNKARQEEFKVNSRLFGTDFMDSHAYLDTLIKDFGALRALQLVPSLLSIQPDILKSSALLLTAKNYLLQHEEALQRDLRVLQKMKAPEISQDGVDSTVGSVVEESSSSSSVDGAAKMTTPPPVVTPTPSYEVRPEESRANADAAVDGPAPAVSDTVNLVRKEPATAIATSIEATKSVEPMPEPQVAGQAVTPPPVIDVAVVSPVQTSMTAAPAKSSLTTLPVKEHAESETPSDSDDELRAENLFGETIDPAPETQQRQRQSNVTGLSAVAPTSPVSSTRSFDEAESLFGERLSSSSRSSTGRRKTVTWGDTQTVEAPAAPSTPVKTAKKPAPLLFGLATAAAFDSDSDEESD